MKNILHIRLFVVMMLLVSGMASNSSQAIAKSQLTAPAAAAVLDQRSRVSPENQMMNERFKKLLPKLMAETNIDLWLVMAREYAEDPVFFSLVPQPVFAARRTTMLIYHLKDDGSVDALSVNTYPFGVPYKSVWSGGDLDEQWQALGALIKDLDPQRIGINSSRNWPVADGLTEGLHKRLLEVLPSDLEKRLVSAEELVVRWVETRIAEEQAVYPHVVQLARAVIAEGFSSKVITPGVTTTEDVAWFIRQRFHELDLQVWFMPYVNLQRAGIDCPSDNPFCATSGVIQPGDVLHTDVGICYLKLCTDTQEMGYVLKQGESDVPQDLKDALAIGNKWQDHLTSSFKTGLTGNQILAETQRKAKGEGIESSTYTHPIGFFGHAPGPTIGMWDNQDETPIRGDWPLYPNTAYAIEGNIRYELPMWNGQGVRIKLEQVAMFDGERVIYTAGRQTRFHVVGPKTAPQ
ncbi:M24 family metallopeptidase [Glaciecola petra]|uniref:M24 family metallopeptidase n=1 Tax=Glaciecola petra TaxID=3075602 RepID=A0ABU2ZY16_9ALTE|nr:M24 family metallopeptidase [Aestuariibacter sp. P117]MDT0596302.1 M24 family metallopeptidase [Aestuariibacter sp. P117]